MNKFINYFKKQVLKTTRFSGFFLKYYFKNDNIDIFSSKKNHVFFGYYDKSPFNNTAEYLLAGHLPIRKKFFNNNASLSLGFYDLRSNKFNFIDKTKAWCWQQGARLFWHPINPNIVTYNKLINGKYKNIFYDLEKNKTIHLIDKPSYDLSNDGKISLSLNFERLQKLRPGYGYNDLGNSNISNSSPSNDGIYLTTINDKKSELIIHLEEIANYNQKKEMKGSIHYFNHISINPISTGFIFLHLWTKNDKRSSRLFYYDLITNAFDQLSENPVAHYAWTDENQLLVTEEYDYRVYYNLYDIKTKKKHTIAENKLRKDGHPTIFENKQKIIYDSYPDRLGYQSLNLFDITKNFNKILFKTYMPNQYTGEFKCDLHPRLSRENNKIISIDLVHNNKRAMGIIKI